MNQAQIIVGDCRQVLATLEAGSVHCCVTSPPYWGLRDYGVDGQIGLEASFDLWLEEMVSVFREVKRVLRDDGTLWLNIGDAYNAGTSAKRKAPRTNVDVGGWADSECDGGARLNALGLKTKDLIGMPWELAFALRRDGWYLRSDIIWHKPNPMPESVRDRPTKSHEYIFLLSKGPKYYYDADAIVEACSENTHARIAQDVDRQNGSTRTYGGTRSHRPMKTVVRQQPGVNPKAAAIEPGDHRGRPKQNASFAAATAGRVLVRNSRSVWTIPTEGFDGAHYATFPRELAGRCIKAGCPAGGLVLDPFGGTATTAEVALKLGRRAVCIELNPEYAALARKRLSDRVPLFAGSAVEGAKTT